MNRLDPILLSLIQNRLDNISMQMGWVMIRTARSPIFSQSHDFSCFSTDSKGVLVSQADGVPIHSGGGGFAVRAVLNAFPNGVSPGDVYLSSDPYVAGGNHLPDWVLTRPVFLGDELVAFSCIRAHQSDIAGGVAGTYNPGATDIFQEGIRLPPLLLIDKGVERADLWALLLLNTRCPEELDGDLRAMLGSTQIGAQQIQDLTRELGIARTHQYFNALLDYGEKALQSLLHELPDGVYSARDRLQNDCFEDREIPIHVKLTKDGGRLTVDFTGTNPQIKGFKNSSLANTHSAVYAAVASFLSEGLPRNEGTFRCVTVVAPLGSLVNPCPPAPVGLCTTTPGQEIMHAVWWALGQADPKRALAGWGKSCFPINSGHDEGKNTWVMYHFNSTSGAGATIERDGFNQMGPMITLGGLMLPNAELCEQDYPVKVLRQEFRTDAGGPGEHRGGTGVVYEVEIERDSEFVFRGEGVGEPSGIGVLGGGSGVGGRITVLDKYGKRMAIPSFGTMPAGPSRLKVESAGGGGYGDPFARDVDLVLRDVMDGVVSVASALQDYGVAIDGTGSIDGQKTAQIRAARDISKRSSKPTGRSPEYASETRDQT